MNHIAYQPTKTFGCFISKAMSIKYNNTCRLIVMTGNSYVQMYKCTTKLQNEAWLYKQVSVKVCIYLHQLICLTFNVQTAILFYQELVLTGSANYSKLVNLHSSPADIVFESFYFSPIGR